VTERVCFLLRIDPAHADDYVREHENIWPDMVTALENAGYRNYSLFLDPSGLLVGYFETDDAQASWQAMRDDPVGQRWSAHMNWMFLPVDADRPVGQLTALRHVFHLHTQPAEAEAIR
jgi:L-rhamnose mutarotase